MNEMAGGRKSTSLFDDIFKLQNAAPELDVDPEDPEDGFRSGLVEGVDESDNLGPSLLRKKTAIIPDDPKYKGRQASRSELYSDDDDFQDPDISDGDDADISEDDSDEDAASTDDNDDEQSMEEGTDSGNDDGEIDTELNNKEDAVIMAPPDEDDREKGKAVTHQLGVWDDLIKCRISLQKVVSSCNRLPNCDAWDNFSSASEEFHQLSANVHSTVRKVLSSMFDLQDLLESKNVQTKKSSQEKGGSDEEITSESDSEEKEDVKKESVAAEREAENSDVESDEDEGINEEETKTEGAQSGEMGKKSSSLKRKLNAEHVEEILCKKHKDYQSYRNDTLAKWDEKTRLSHAKLKSKNFAAFDMSVLKQIQQVLANRGRLIRRIHQNRSTLRILGQPEKDEQGQAFQEVVEDDDDEVELKAKTKQELPIDFEVIDDSDFYHICLRDLIELKQNEETDPILSSKHWLEIQRLRNRHKRKVDTRASKGRKIRYNVKEKLKNYMTPYDKSNWSEEQREDLFKALFGGSAGLGVKDCVNSNGNTNEIAKEPMTINIGL